jgi:hypothetical protein
MLEIFTFTALVILIFILFFVLNNVAAVRQYTLAQFHLKLKLSNLENSEKIQLAKKYGLGYDPENDL